MAHPLSRAYLSLKEARSPSEIETEQVNILQYLLVKDETFYQIQNLTQEDATLKTLAGVIT